VRIHVVQSRLGAWLPERYEMMSVGWRYIVADLQTYIATGVHARRHLRPWGDLGADATAIDGGIRVDRIREGGLVSRLGLDDGDLLVTLAGAPVASLDDLVTVLRVLDRDRLPAAEWIRSGSLLTARAHRWS
jgi:S1-C subfamily serine protease